MEDILLLDSVINCLSMSSNDFCCGCAGALEGTLEPFVPPGTLRLSLKPDFSMEKSDIQLYGMVSIRLGHIICAALIGAWNYIARRIRHGKASD